MKIPDWNIPDEKGIINVPDELRQQVNLLHEEFVWGNKVYVNKKFIKACNAVHRLQKHFFKLYAQQQKNKIKLKKTIN